MELNWRNQQPTAADNIVILLAGYEAVLLDTSREIQYNKLSVNEQGDVEAIIQTTSRRNAMEITFRPWGPFAG